MCLPLIRYFYPFFLSPLCVHTLQQHPDCWAPAVRSWVAHLLTSSNPFVLCCTYMNHTVALVLPEVTRSYSCKPAKSDSTTHTNVWFPSTISTSFNLTPPHEWPWNQAPNHKNLWSRIMFASKKKILLRHNGSASSFMSFLNMCSCLLLPDICISLVLAQRGWNNVSLIA